MTTAPLPVLPPRPDNGHKGTFGTVCVVGGQCHSNDSARVMIGGPAFTALAALRSGAGLAVLAMPQPILPHALVIAPSATGLALPIDSDGRLCASDVAEALDPIRIASTCLAIGPGLGASEPARQVVLRLIGLDDRPMVIDADALNCLAATTDFHRDLRAPAVLTPHPGEFARLAERLELSANATDPHARPDAAAQLARRLGCVVVLKGHRTVISDGINTTVNDTGNVALATAGTGDVLTGILAGLIAQHYHGGDGLNLFDCARLAVHVHGRAADAWAQQHGPGGLLADELLPLIPAALQSMY